MRTANIDKTRNNKCWWGNGKEGTLACTLLVGLQIVTATLESSMEVSQNTKNTNTIQPTNSTSENLHKGKKITNPKR